MKDRCPSEGDAEAQPNAEPLSVRTNVLVTAIAAAWPTAELMKDRCPSEGDAEAQPNAEPLSVRTNVLVTAIGKTTGRCQS